MDTELIKKYLENKRNSMFIGQEKAVNTSEEINKRDIENHKEQLKLVAELIGKNYNCDKLAFDFHSGKLWIQDVNETTIKKYKKSAQENN